MYDRSAVEVVTDYSERPSRDTVILRPLMRQEPTCSANEDNREAVLRLFREHGPGIYRFALVLLHQRQDAEDVVQEVFLKLLMHLESGRDRSNLRGWLFTVAAHACRDRTRYRVRWIPWGPEAEQRAEAVEAAQESDQGTVVRESLRRLPRRDRALLMLRAQGLSYREIAAAAGIKPTSVGRLLARALARWERAYSA